MEGGNDAPTCRRGPRGYAFCPPPRMLFAAYIRVPGSAMLPSVLHGSSLLSRYRHVSGVHFVPAAKSDPARTQTSRAETAKPADAVELKARLPFAPEAGAPV